jgi:hypothetical protein
MYPGPISVTPGFFEPMRRRLARPGSLVLLAAAALACTTSGDTVVYVSVNLSFRSAAGTAVVLRVAVEDERRTAMHDFARPDRSPLVFPTSFTLQLPREIQGPLKLEVRALDAGGATLARGVIGRLELRTGRQQRTEIWLDCFGACPADAGAPDGGVDQDGPSDAPVPPTTCGNGLIDPGETCDTAILPGKPGACPASCDDGLPCTIDMRVGSGCTAECVHAEIRTAIAGDRCCPANTTFASDPDCSSTCGNGTIEPGETCDTDIPPGKPGACPTAATCLDRDACTENVLISAGTCSAVCVLRPIVKLIPGDGCCPAGATSRTDRDCPFVCGNGIVEMEAGETCDKGIPAGQPGACPTACDDKNPCTIDVLEGSGCKAVCRSYPIRTFVGGDGCCPQGGTRNLDADCPALCGNGVLEPGEACDKAIAPGRPGACPTVCPREESPCTPLWLEGDAEDCSARCVVKTATQCNEMKDGCCPEGCTALNDPDCSPTCGNGIVESHESCDTAIAPGGPGACPTVCADENPCTTDQLVSDRTCHALCRFAPVTTFMSGDQCCPSGGNALLDSDCPPVCGNQVVEPPKETCDRGIAAGMPGACPTECPPTAGCTRYVLTGDGALCNVRCVAEPIKACLNGDGCCPSGCNKSNDNDCPAVCGNGVVEPGEACDKAITAGNPGACPASCDDNDACTADTTSGSVGNCTRTCSHVPITACTTGDKCCPTGCSPETDGDCAPICGNGVIEKGESCDPPNSCPTTCPDDGDPCTADKLIGAPSMCSAVCTHVPITNCSGATADGCCPTGCSSRQDVDCPATTLAR